MSNISNRIIRAHAAMQPFHPNLRSCRLFNSNAETAKKCNYIDQWHRETVKPTSFYTKHAAANLRRKSYFYSIDLQGRVFLEETIPKNITTSLKNIQFLDFFFRRLRRITPMERDFLDNTSPGAGNDYPFVSPCGVEMNYIRPADLAVVFHTLKIGTSGDEPGAGGMIADLVFGATLAQPFFPGNLALSQRSGRLYHLLSLQDCSNKDDESFSERNAKDALTHQRAKRKETYPTPLHKPDGIDNYGLFKSSLAVTLSEYIVTGPSFSLIEKKSEEKFSGMDFICPITEKRYPIIWLPKDNEPGSWSLPPEVDERSC